MSNPTKDDIESAEEFLTEILVSALKCAPHLREHYIAVADGISQVLSDEAIERCKDYAKFRVHSK